MASHHHHHHCQPVAAASSTCYCCCYSTCCAPPPHDPLLHSQPPHLIHHTPPQHHLYSPYPNPPYDPQSLHHHHHQQQQQHQPPPTTHPRKQPRFESRHFEQQKSEEDQPLVSSLLRRIATLESSLRRKCAANPASSSTLRDAAARTIQTHFRAFLVRRSRALRQLKDLAFIKSTLNALKSSLSENAGTDPKALYLKATDLLLQLDSIQGGDPMIRDGKRSISREIIRFLGFVDGLLPKRNELSSIELKSVRSGGSGSKTRVLYSGKKMGTANVGAREERILLEKLRERIKNLQGFSRVPEDEDEGFQFVNSRITAKTGSLSNMNGGLLKKLSGAQAKVKKTVTFADNGNVSRVVISSHEPVSGKSTSSSDGSDSTDEEKELREVEEIGVISKGSDDDDDDDDEEEEEQEEEEETQSGDGNITYNNDRGGHFGKNLRAEEDCYEISGRGQGEEGDFAFSAPLPVKMESRADLMKRKSLKIAD